MISKNKRGSFLARHSAILVFILAGLILAYILAIPPSERIKLLSDRENITENETIDEINDVFLDVNLGNLEPIRDSTVKKSFPTSRIKAKEDLDIILDLDSEELKSNLFENDYANYLFSTKRDYESLELSFDVDSKNSFEIVLNDFLIHKGEIDKGLFKKNIDAHIINNTQNDLEIKLKDIGWDIFSSYQTNLKNLKLIGRFLDESDSVYQTNFGFEGDVYNYLEQSSFYFYVDCIKEGNLKIFLNNNSLYDGQPVCSNKNKIDIPINSFNPNNNQLKMQTEGDLYLTDLYLEHSLNETDIKAHTFTLTEDNLDEDIFLKLQFASSGDEKVADISINGATRRIETNHNFWERNITSFVFKGTNFIKVFPYEEMDIIQLKVYSP
ncbi:MAG: hypothetical protein ACOCRX_01185 [Candidatus Woesearchaeota archaeon]